MTFKPHSEKQDALIISEKKFTVAATGVQWGKSVSAVIRLLIAMFKYNSKDDNFIVTSPTYKILYQSTIPVFNSICEGKYGKWDKKNETFRIKGGGTIYFRSGQNPDSVVGITNVRHIVCDEGGLYTRYFWDNIQARSSIKSCPITIVTSPYSLNWLWTDFIRKYRDGDPYITACMHLCQANSSENPYFPKEEYENRRHTMDSRRFNMVYGGVFDRAIGLVYDCFDVQIYVVEPFKLPNGTRFFGGLDWGYVDPTVIKVRAVTEDGMHYSVHELYQTQMRIADIIDACHRLKAMFQIEKFYCDPSRPEYIEEMNRNGLRAQGANNEIIKGIETHYELIKRGDYAVFRDSSKHTVDEYETYHYPDPKDLKPDQNSSEKINLPVGQHDHCMDVERYISMGTHRIGHAKNRVVKESETVIPSRTVSTYDKDLAKLLKKKPPNADLPL